MPAPQALLKNCLGLNVGVDSLRVKYDVNSGATFLAACSNVTVDQGKRISRRKGMALKSNTAGKDIFSDGVDCVLHTGAALYRILSDYSLAGIRNGLSADAEMFFARSPEGIFYNNGVERGRIERLGPSHVWDKPTTNYEPIIHLTPYGPPSNMTHIHHHLGHMLCAVDDVAYYSDHGSYNVFYPERDFWHFPDRITGFASARSTPFVFTETGVYAQVGATFGGAQEIVASNIPAIPGTVATIVSLNSEFNMLPMWLTMLGVYVGFPDGSARNVSDDRLVLPEDIYKGKATCHNGQYVAVLSR